MIKAPISYNPTFILKPQAWFDRLWTELPWERRDNAPRFECWMNMKNEPYTYGKFAGERTYYPVPFNYGVRVIKEKLFFLLGCDLEGCFINGYATGRDALGWHADDSLMIDHTKPIAIVSFGSERKIWFRANGQTGVDHEEVMLENGSLLVMAPGMQQTHQHRIPKSDRECGPRISLTFRGMV